MNMHNLEIVDLILAAIVAVLWIADWLIGRRRTP
jgi:preprotein translocase subunit SecE